MLEDAHESKLTSGARTEAEYELIERLAHTVPDELSITLLADRGFGNQVL